MVVGYYSSEGEYKDYPGGGGQQANTNPTWNKYFLFRQDYPTGLPKLYPFLGLFMAVASFDPYSDQNITNYESLKSAVQESEARYSRVMEYLDREIMVYAVEPKIEAITYVSSSVENILGYTPAEFIRPVAEHWTSHPLNDEAKRKAKLSLQGVRQPPYRMELYHQDGTCRLLETTEFPIFSKQGDVIRVESIVRDITERNKAEEKLAQTRKSYEDWTAKAKDDLARYQKQLIDSVEFFMDPTYMVDIDGKITVWNRAMEAISGISKNEAIRKKYKSILRRFYKDDKPLLMDLLGGNLKKIQQTNEEIREENGSLIVDRYLPRINKGAGGYVRVSASYLLDRDGKKLGAIGSVRDIAEPTVTEVNQRQKEKWLSSILMNLPGIAFQLSQSNDWQIDFISRGSKLLLGYEPSYFEGTRLSKLFELIHEDDRQRVEAAFRSAVAGSHPFSTDYRVYTTSGESKWVFHYSISTRKEDGLVGVEGYIIDFNSYKKGSIDVVEPRKKPSISRDKQKFGNIIGNSRVMRDVYELIVKAAGTTDSVFISGESGTGKELVSQAIHNASDRATSKCVTVNCGAIPENLIESEFFGYLKGAFTGATTDKKGFLEDADGGTLFLDEIGEISLNMQVKLLRAIEGGGFSPIGSRRVIRPNLRIIAASNKDPIELVKQEKMRSDFYFRIHVIPIHLPPLRDRENDIIFLIEYFLSLYNHSDKTITLTKEEYQILKRYHWPGNVRELQNVIRRYIALRNLDFLTYDPIFDESANGLGSMSKTDQKTTLAEAVDEFEKKFITQTLQQNRWQKGKTADVLNISRKTLFRKMKEYQIS